MPSPFATSNNREDVVNEEAYIHGYLEKESSDTMRQLLAAKIASDKRDWATKNRILRKLINEKQED